MTKSNLTEEEKDKFFNSISEILLEVSGEKSTLKQFQLMSSMRDRIAEIYDEGFSKGHSCGLLQSVIEKN